MSKLTDALRRTMRREARPIGFATAATTQHATLVILARPGADDPAAVLAAGADALVLGSLTGGTGVWGTDAPLSTPAAARDARKAGADFVIFDADTTAAAALLDDDLAYIMRLDLDTPEALLRGVESLPLDCVLTPALDGALTVRRTLDLRRLMAFTRKPMLLPVKAEVTVDTLEALRDCGVAGVVTEGAAATAALRATIAKLSPRKRHEKGSRGVSLAVPARGDSYEVEELPEDDED